MDECYLSMDKSRMNETNEVSRTQVDQQCFVLHLFFHFLDAMNYQLNGHDFECIQLDEEETP
jgi:hypothetical protein